jgi:hypothetical protein
MLCVLEAYELTPVRGRILIVRLMPTFWVDEAIHEFQRYLGLLVISPQPVPMISKAVDDYVWHTCLLFTDLFADRYEATIGCFVQHDTADEGDALSDTNRLDFRARYQRLCGVPGRL